jgi:hypothetical protein
MLLGGLFMFWFLAVFAILLVPLGFTIYALVDVGRAPDEAFGPPWDNGKSAWTLGLALAFVVPGGTIVAPILWWTQGRAALRRGQRVPRPFWSPGPRPPAPPGYGPPPIGQPPQQP